MASRGKIDRFPSKAALGQTSDISCVWYSILLCKKEQKYVRARSLPTITTVRLYYTISSRTQERQQCTRLPRARASKDLSYAEPGMLSRYQDSLLKCQCSRSISPRCQLITRHYFRQHLFISLLTESEALERHEASKILYLCSSPVGRGIHFVTTWREDDVYQPFGS